MKALKSRFKLILSCVLVLNLAAACSEDEKIDAREALHNLHERIKAGGATSLAIATTDAFGTPAPNLSPANLELHNEGDVDFEAQFVAAGKDVLIGGGLGPVFNNNSCIACHPSDGRPAFPANINKMTGLALKISMGNDPKKGPKPVPGYGIQARHQATLGVQVPAKYALKWTKKTVKFADGTSVELRKPHFSLVDLAPSFPKSGVLISPRMAPPVFGIGLLEYIPESDLLANQDIEDANGDGISGKANYVRDVQAPGQLKIGRFGWKAGTPTSTMQVAGAYWVDMGITSPLFKNNLPKIGFESGKPEIDMQTVEEVTFYCQTLAVPEMRNADDPQVQRGAKVFEELNCIACHTPKQRTLNSPIKELANQTLYPYTDLLLHDMGEDLADGRPEYLASGQEWQTRPLWGIGLTNLVNGHTNFLHDGRARNITEAILWHGGEAEESKEGFRLLDKQDREALLAFLNSL